MNIKAPTAHALVAMAITAVAMLCIFQCSKANADSWRHNQPVTNIYLTEEVTEVTEQYITEEYNTQVTNQVADGIALSLSAAALQFDWSSDDWQYSGGLGNYKDSTSGSVGLGKRFGGVLFNGSYNQGFNSGDPGYNFGISGKFK